MSQFFEATEPHIIYTLFGFFVCLFGVISLFVKEKLYIGEAVISTVFGIIIGPACIGIFTPLNWSESDIITLELTRVIIAIQVSNFLVVYIVLMYRSLPSALNCQKRTFVDIGVR